MVNMTDKEVFGIIAYIISVFFISLIWGSKATMYFVVLVLLGVLFVNAAKIEKGIKNIGFVGGGGSSGGGGSTRDF